MDYEKLMPGLKLTLDSTFQPIRGQVQQVKTEYKHEKLINADMGVTKSPVVNMSAAVRSRPYALGYQTAFDTGKSALTKHNLALNNANDGHMHGSHIDFKVYGGGIYLKNSSAH